MAENQSACAEEHELFLSLGQELRAVREEEAEKSGLESLRGMAEGQESLADLVDLGRSYFNRISQSAYEVLCGSGEGSAQWKSLADSGEKALITGLSALLVAHLALVAAVATAVAAIIVKLFYDASHKELCSRWQRGLPAATT